MMLRSHIKPNAVFKSGFSLVFKRLNQMSSLESSELSRSDSWSELWTVCELLVQPLHRHREVQPRLALKQEQRFVVHPLEHPHLMFSKIASGAAGKSIHDIDTMPLSTVHPWWERSGASTMGVDARLQIAVWYTDRLRCFFKESRLQGIVCSS